MKALSTLYLMLRSAGHATDPPPVEMNDAYQNLARYAADLSSLVLLLQTMVACPASGYQNPVVVTHYFPSDSVDRLQVWVNHVAKYPHLTAIVIHVDLPESTQNKLKTGNVTFVPLESFGSGIPAHVYSTTYLRYFSTLAAIQALDGARPADGVLLTRLSEMTLARDPFAWMALLKEEYGLFVSSEIEGYNPGLFERFHECFGAGSQEGTTVQSSGSFYTPYLIGGRTSVVSAVLTEMLSAFKTLSQYAQTAEKTRARGLEHEHCETAVLNLKLWEKTLKLKGSEKFVPIFSGAPFSPPFHWAESQASTQLAARAMRSQYSHYSTYYKPQSL